MGMAVRIDRTATQIECPSVARPRTGSISSSYSGVLLTLAFVYHAGLQIMAQ